MRRAAAWFCCLVLLPLALLAGAEGALRLSGYGHDTSPFLATSMDGKEVWLRNRHFFHTYLGWKIPQESWDLDELVIPMEKPPNTCRIFVFGESAPQGWPDPYFSFARVLEVQLKERFPGLRFEVFNTAMRAVNSHALLRVAAACAEMSPDFFVVYMGNNEVHGPFGLISISNSSRFPSMAEVRLQEALPELRLLQWMNSLLPPAMPQPGAIPPPVRPDDPRLPEVYRRFEMNLRKICGHAEAAGAEPILCTIAKNLRDWQPVESFASPGLTQAQTDQFRFQMESGMGLLGEENYIAARAEFERALEIDGHYAEAWYRLGRCQWAQGQKEEACGSFHRAYVQDGFSWMRAKPEVNSIVRKVGGDLKAPIADVDEAMFRASEDNCPGLESFDDSCHFNPHGAYVCALSVLDTLIPRIEQRFGTTAEGASLSFVESMGRSGIHPIMRAGFVQRMVEQRHLWDRESFARLRRIKALCNLGATDEISLLAQFLAGSAGHPHADPLVYLKYAEVLLRTDRIPDSMAAVEQGLKLAPYNRALLRMMGRAKNFAGDFEGAAEAFRNCLALYPDDITCMDELAVYAERVGDKAALRHWTEQATAVEDLPVRKLFRRGKLRILDGDESRGAKLLIQAIEADPYYPNSYDELDKVLMAHGDEKRIATWTAIHESKPDYPRPALFFARALHAAGRRDEALAAYRKVQELDALDPLAAAAIAELTAP